MQPLFETDLCTLEEFIFEAELSRFQPSTP